MRYIVQRELLNAFRHQGYVHTKITGNIVIMTMSAQRTQFEEVHPPEPRDRCSIRERKASHLRV